LVIVVKTTVSALITKAFGYGLKTSFLVGIMLAQIGEFAKRIDAKFDAFKIQCSLYHEVNIG
ncbi:hypothetical protein Tco_0384603, partial [Tanacetum coccineum]